MERSAAQSPEGARRRAGQARRAQASAARAEAQPEQGASAVKGDGAQTSAAGADRLRECAAERNGGGCTRSPYVSDALTAFVDCGIIVSIQRIDTFRTVNRVDFTVLWMSIRSCRLGGAAVDAHQIVARLMAALIIWAADVYIYHRRR